MQLCGRALMHYIYTFGFSKFHVSRPERRTSTLVVIFSYSDIYLMNGARTGCCGQVRSELEVKQLVERGMQGR
jgi:hypothetical protein